MQVDAQAQASGSKWLRLLYMVLFFIFYRVAEIVMWAVTAFQVLCALLLGGPHPRAQALGESLARYAAQCWRYLTYNSEMKPFPFAEWPDGRVPDGAPGERPLDDA